LYSANRVGSGAMEVRMVRTWLARWGVGRRRRTRVPGRERDLTLRARVRAARHSARVLRALGRETNRGWRNDLLPSTSIISKVNIPSTKNANQECSLCRCRSADMWVNLL
jgi:hypothetical protein